jgi:FAD dependent oxidoreductase TIGR03364
MSASATYADAVIGAGILGLATAYQLARRGRRVVVLERDARASGASIRNFGMLWPIGQPIGPLRTLARSSLDMWLSVLGASGLWHDRGGSLHLAYRDDEAQVLSEFAAECRETGEPVELLLPAQVCERAPAVKGEGLKLGLYSPIEVCVDPREVVSELPGWLNREYGVEFRFRCAATNVDLPTIVAGADQLTASRAWVCSGDELDLLYADEFARCGLFRCKLQMMRSTPQDIDDRLGPMLAAGLTLRHYASFRNCPSLGELERRVATESPWLNRFGIHVLVAQNGAGELTIGDSHEYGAAIEPFDKTEIDEWIISYLKTFLEVPHLRIASRWHGTYVKHPAEPYLVIRPAPGVTAISGVGGAGMTFSFGLADRVVGEVLGEGGSESSNF